MPLHSWFFFFPSLFLFPFLPFLSDRGSLEKALSVTDVRQLLIKSEHLLQGVPLIVPEISSMSSNIIIPCLLFALAYMFVCFGSTYPLQRVTSLVTAHLLWLVLWLEKHVQVSWKVVAIGIWNMFGRGQAMLTLKAPLCVEEVDYWTMDIASLFQGSSSF